MVRKLLAAALAASLMTAPAAAQQTGVPASGGFVTARDLYTSCTSPEEREVLACRTYIMGVADSMAMHMDNRWAPMVLCNASQLRIDQLGALYVEFMRRNQQMADWTAAATVYNALAARYSCTVQQPNG